MEDREVGESWFDWYTMVDEFGEHGGCRDAVLKLIRKLVEERAELNYRRQGGKWAYLALLDREHQEWRLRAIRDFGIDPETWGKTEIAG